MRLGQALSRKDILHQPLQEEVSQTCFSSDQAEKRGSRNPKLHSSSANRLEEIKLAKQGFQLLQVGIVHDEASRASTDSASLPLS